MIAFSLIARTITISWTSAYLLSVLVALGFSNEALLGITSAVFMTVEAISYFCSIPLPELHLSGAIVYKKALILNRNTLPYLYGKVPHRENGPAVYYGRERLYYVFGMLHRIGGPALTGMAEVKDTYWLFGHRYEKAQYEALTDGRTEDQIAIAAYIGDKPCNYLSFPSTHRESIEKFLTHRGKASLILNMRAARTLT